MKNLCHFSPCKKYRYSLYCDHDMGDLFRPQKTAMWLMLNPSTATVHKLDATLRRVRSFSKREGCTGFYVTNLFAYRATKPKDMKAQMDPVGPENDRVILETARKADLIIAGWGTDGDHLGRKDAVLDLLAGFTIHCLGQTKDGEPRHPLYVLGNKALKPYRRGKDLSSHPLSMRKGRAECPSV